MSPRMPGSSAPIRSWQDGQRFGCAEGVAGVVYGRLELHPSISLVDSRYAHGPGDVRIDPDDQTQLRVTLPPIASGAVPRALARCLDRRITKFVPFRLIHDPQDQQSSGRGASALGGRAFILPSPSRSLAP
jgi:hypothetical protein